jgi:hypothetical protein
MSVARELGLGTQNKVDGNFNGVGVRWRKPDVEGERGSTPIAQRFLKYQGEKGHRRHEKNDNFEDVVAGVVKAFVGLIYRERVSTLSISPLHNIFYFLYSSVSYWDES